MKPLAEIILWSGLWLSPMTTAQTNPLGLYIRDRYATVDGAPCTFCAERDGCFLISRAFYVQDECRGRGTGRSAVYSELEGDVVCRQDFRNDGTRCDIPEQLPMFNATMVENCGQVWPSNICEVLSESSIRMTVLDDWCIQSDVPEEPYVMPIASARIYANVDSCANGNQNFQTSLFAADESLCMPSTVDDIAGNETVLLYGSRRNYCEGSVLRSEKYVDRACSDPTTLGSSFDGVSDVCPAESSSENGRVEIVDCAAPSVYCKTLYSTDIGFSLAPDPTPSPMAAPTTKAPIQVDSGASNQLTGRRLLLLGFSWVIVVLSM